MTAPKFLNQPEPAARKAARPRNIPLPEGRIYVQPRDLDLLVDLHTYGCMLRSQIQTLYFGSISRTNARLRQLFDAGYIKKAPLPLPSCLSTLTGCQSAYILGPAGIPIVAARTGLDPNDIRRQQRHGTTGYLLHTTEIVNFRLALEMAVRSQSAVTLEQFFPERLCRHGYEYRERPVAETGAEVTWRKEVYKPDAVILLSRQSVVQGWAIEIDLGHTSSAEFTMKLQIHTRYAATGLFARRYGAEKVGTLIVTTSAHRRANLIALAKKVNGGHFWFTTYSEIKQDGALGPIWHTPGTNSPHSLF